MNKKVLTLCAGFLLAGGMLSSLSAEKLTVVADNGKYYKMEEGAYITNGTSWTKDKTGTWFLDLNQSEEATLAHKSVANDYWKVVTVENGYELINFNGDKLIVNGVSVFNFKEDFKTDAQEQNAVGFSQLYQGANSWIGYDKTLADNSYKLEAQNLSDGYGVAFDAIATSLEDVNLGLDRATLDLNGENVTFKFIIGDYAAPIIYKATYDKENNSYSFANNATGETIYFTDATNGEREKDVTIVPCENGMGSFLQLPSGGKYVAIINGEFSLVDSWDKATMFGFQITNTRVAVSVDVLNYYEKDGFSVEINGYDTKNEPTIDLAGNPFTGHLTPMVLATENGKNVFKKAVDQDADAKEYYLKDEAGNYIVAMKYNVEGAESSQALYKFTTVTEEALLHNIARAWNHELEDNQIYFGLFRASVDEAALDEDKTALDEITWLEVNIDPYDEGVATYHYAELGQANIGETPTLVAVATQIWNQFKLYPIHISLQPGNLVDWRELLQPKFFTVEQYKADGTTLIGKLTASGIKATEFKKTPAGNDLENQFALTIESLKLEGDYAERDYYVFANRETPTSEWAVIPVNALYTTDKDYTYKYGNNVYVIKPVAEVNEADGYARFSDSQLNRQYRIAYSSAVFGNVAYLTENHDDAKDAQYHTIGLNPEKKDALVFNIKKYNAARDLKDEQENHTYDYHPTDSIYVVSNLGFYNTKTKKYDTAQDTLKVLAYTFVNQFNEPLVGLNKTNATTAEDYAFVSDVYKNGTDKYANVSDAHANATKFAVREDNGKYNLRPLYTWKEEINETDYNEERPADLYQEFSLADYWPGLNYNKMYAGDALNGILSYTDLYTRTENDLFDIEETESEVYRRLANNVDTISIYRNDNEKSLLYEKTMKINDTTSVNFLGLENIADFTEMAPAMIADTAYVRYDTYKPQYMLVVDPTIHPAGKWCDVCESADCEHAVPTPAWTEGRFLVNLVDSAKAWDEAHKHQVGNPYKNTENYYKLGFIQATHRNDSLIVDGNRQFIGNNDNHIAKFQFRYVDTEDKSFVIETSLDGTQTPGYLKWMNGVVAVVDDIKNADVYNMNEDESRQPTANEEISANAAVSVVATDGAVIVKGAEGKNIVV